MNIVRIFLTLTIVISMVCCSSSEKCKTDSDCPKNNKCIHERCFPNAYRPDPQVIDPGIGCSNDSECGYCKKCDDGICVAILECDVGFVALDGSRDVVKTDSIDIDEIADAGMDIVDVDADWDAYDIVEDAGTEDILTDVTPSDITDITCDINLSLKVVKREPAGDLPRGTVMTISGQGFDTECGTLSVYFNGDPNPAKILDKTSTKISVVIPGFAKSGRITVNSLGQVDSSLSVKIQRRLFFTDFGDVSSPGTKFFILSFPNFSEFREGKYDTSGEFPVPILLDPYNLMIIVVTKNKSSEGYTISAYDFSDVKFIKSVVNNNAKSMISNGAIDYEKKKIYLISMDGYLYIHEMESFKLLDTIKIGESLYGIEIDKTKNRIFLSGVSPPIIGPPEDLRAAIFIISRDDYGYVNRGKIVFGEPKSVSTDVKYHPTINKVFTVDYTKGELYVFSPDDKNSDLAPVSLGVESGPMKVSFGSNMSKVYIACNNSSQGPKNATASVKAFYVDTLGEVLGSPLDTKLITSTESTNSKHLVNMFYDDLDKYLIVVSNADNRIAVVDESTFALLSNPRSPDDTKTSSLSGNFGISVEDW
ncbi:MAG: IPT/TIG domain-containing protein [Deltaproteobacteria bacterium]|nr:IPT/TIG domain-containing protein [Deltaproteobacteria bacterium]